MAGSRCSGTVFSIWARISVFESSAVGYALVYVYTPKATDSVLLLGSDDGATVWLNGTEIYRIDANRPPIPDEDAVPCHLNAGWNEVLCKVSQEGWGWGLYLRFTDVDGVLRYSTQPEEIIQASLMINWCRFFGCERYRSPQRPYREFRPSLCVPWFFPLGSSSPEFFSVVTVVCVPNSIHNNATEIG